MPEKTFGTSRVPETVCLDSRVGYNCRLWRHAHGHPDSTNGDKATGSHQHTCPADRRAGCPNGDEAAGSCRY